MDGVSDNNVGTMNSKCSDTKGLGDVAEVQLLPLAGFMPSGKDQKELFHRYTTLPRRFPPMVPPLPAILDHIVYLLESNGCDAIFSIGSGGRLDLERAVASVPRAQIHVVAVDTVPTCDVVDEGVTYVEMTCGGDTYPVPPSAALLFCWGSCMLFLFDLCGSKKQQMNNSAPL
eukprot:m.524446 g.524446  ORF g.524446 m.524446 type:complete len:173 (-) comp21988_c0_seq6:1946-2464(-)